LKFCVHTKKIRNYNSVHENLFTPFLVPAREQVLSWEKKLPISDWLGELQTTSRKTQKSFVKPPLYLLALALLALALALAQRTNGERLTYGNTKKNMGAVE